MTPTFEYQSESVEDTLRFGRRLGQTLEAGLTIALVGPLGAGKTHLVKGLALGNGLEGADRVTSPTFVLVNEYPGRLPLHHLDVYRLKEVGEYWELGVEEMLDDGGVAVIEWADRMEHALPPDTLWVRIRLADLPDRRVFRLQATGAISRRVVEKLTS